MHNNEFWRHYWRFFIDVLSSKDISIVENVLILNKIQVEENVFAFNTIFGIDNTTDHFGSEIYSKSFDRNFTFMDHMFTRIPAGHAHTSRSYKQATCSHAYQQVIDAQQVMGVHSHTSGHKYSLYWLNLL